MKSLRRCCKCIFLTPERIKIQLFHIFVWETLYKCLNVRKFYKIPAEKAIFVSTLVHQAAYLSNFVLPQSSDLQAPVRDPQKGGSANAVLRKFNRNAKAFGKGKVGCRWLYRNNPQIYYGGTRRSLSVLVLMDSILKRPCFFTRRLEHRI